MLVNALYLCWWGTCPILASWGWGGKRDSIFTKWDTAPCCSTFNSFYFCYPHTASSQQELAYPFHLAFPYVSFSSPLLVTMVFLFFLSVAPSLWGWPLPIFVIRSSPCDESSSKTPGPLKVGPSLHRVGYPQISSSLPWVQLGQGMLSIVLALQKMIQTQQVW